MKIRRGVRNVSCGVLLLAVAALLIAGQLGYDIGLAGLGWFEIIILALCGCGFIGGLLEGHFWEMAFSLGIGYCIISDNMGWPHISLWIMLLAIVVAGAGLKMIFRGKGRHKHRHVYVDGVEREIGPEGIVDGDDHIFTSEGNTTSEDDYLKGDVVFSSMAKYIESRNFRGGESDVVFSHVKYYFDQAQLCGGYARIEISCVFSSVDLYIPKEWNVESNMGKVFSGSDINEIHRDGAPTLILDGEVVFGSVRVYRI